MKQLLSSYAETIIEKGELDDQEYRERLIAWSDATLRADGVLWGAMAEVLRAAIQMDLETPPWCKCWPTPATLSNAIDTVLEALPPAGVQAFDKTMEG